MKASELVDALRDLIMKYGDADVVVDDWSEEYMPPEVVTGVIVNGEKAELRFEIIA